MKKFLITFTVIWLLALLMLQLTQVEMAKAFLSIYTLGIGVFIYAIIIQVKLFQHIKERYREKQTGFSFYLSIFIILTLSEGYVIWYLMTH